jgi:hypothetical protein
MATSPRSPDFSKDAFQMTSLRESLSDLEDAGPCSHSDPPMDVTSDSCYLYHNPGSQPASTLQQASSSLHSPKTATRAGSSKSPVGVRSPKKPRLQDSPSAPKKRKNKAREDGSSKYGLEWEAKLKNAIVQDEELYARILRYEVRSLPNSHQHLLTYDSAYTFRCLFGFG